MNKQDRQGVRSINGLEQKYQFGREFAKQDKAISKQNQAISTQSMTLSQFISYATTALANAVKKAGDTMSGVLDMSGNKITGVATPSNANDAVNKTYVDSNFAPSGYGYGEGLVGLGSTNDDAAFTAKLSEQFAKTANKTRQFYFTHGGGAFLGTLWNAGNNYGVLVATSYAEPNVGYRFKQMVRVCTNGTWGAWVDNSPTAFAPAGYGLGTYSTENKITSKSALDDFKKNGWFVFLNESDPLVVCGLNCSYAYGRVDAYNGSRAKMTITPVVPEKATTFVRYLLSDGKWSAWKPAGTTMELLWENASPTSSFVAQTVSLTLKDYEFVMIESELGSTFCKVGNSTVMFSHNTYYPSRRTVSVTTSGVTFGEGLKYTSCPGDSVASDKNAVCIPRIIYGFKGVG